MRYLLIFLCAALTTNFSYACVVGTMSDDKQLKVHDVVFSGVLEGCEEENDISYFKYTVDRIWKGEIKRTYTKIVKECKQSIISELIGKKSVIFANKIKNSPHLEAKSFGTCPPPSRLLRPEIPIYIFGFPLPSMFKRIGSEDKLEDLGPPIHTFKTNN